LIGSFLILGRYIEFKVFAKLAYVKGVFAERRIFSERCKHKEILNLKIVSIQPAILSQIKLENGLIADGRFWLVLSDSG
jgi:hypothetical protein